ncbi:hypothetical protein JRI60_25140 [Archangium violaceum]|uniref:hypothetical protein n=1 Tax=Archangium violaceum TaxID=83451 RepID=UPI00194DEFC9|nr:hypothetical protein [Archangium violaceum]QRO02060.1 hypothetical protein JRI60_25140 [Archangium violaceum]
MTATSALAALKSVTSSSTHVEVVDGPKNIPADLSALLQKSSDSEVKSHLQSKTSPVASNTLSNESKLEKTPGYFKIENWASGGAPFARFTDQATTTYIDSLFDSVASHLSARYGNKRVLSRNNFFHGHLVLETSGSSPDLLLVFHAFEYPRDLEPTKCGFAGTLEPTVTSFRSSDAAYKWRNAIWSMRLNTIWLIHYADNTNPYRELLADPDVSKAGNPLVLDESKLGKCVADLNTFPKEDVRSFLRIW